MLVRAKVCELTDDPLWFVCGLYVEILTSPLRNTLQTTDGMRAQYSKDCVHTRIQTLMMD